MTSNIKETIERFYPLHEFEADARAAENAGVDNYCRLLARVALEPANWRQGMRY